MSRPQRRERRRRLQKLTRKIDGAKATEAARKASKAVGRLKSVLLGNYGKLTATNARLSADSIASLAKDNPGLLDGKITVKGFRTEGQRGFKLSANERLFIGLQKLTLVAVLEAAYFGLPPDLESRKAWLQVEGFHWIRWAGYEPYIYGYDRSRSIRAQNSGSGKPKPKPRRKTWQEEKKPPQVEYRLLGKTAKGKVFQETGKLDGKVLTERPSRK